MFIFLSVSCQLSRKRLPSSTKLKQVPKAKINQLKYFYSFSQLISKKPSVIYKPNSLDIKSIQYPSGLIECKGKNIIKHTVGLISKIYVRDDSFIECKTSIETEVSFKVEYHRPNKIEEIVDQYKGKPLDLDLVTQLKQEKLKRYFTRKISLEDFKKISFKKGDYVEIELDPQLVKHECLEGSCQEDLPITGTNIFFDQRKIEGSNQLTYPYLEPFIFICGGQFSGSDIVFKSNESLSYYGFVGSNGFNCDINTFSLSNKIPKVWLSLTHITDNLKLTEKKRPPKGLVNFFKALKLLNQNINKELKTKTKGYFEVWLELFKRQCSSSLNCEDQSQLVATKVNKVIKDNSGGTKVINISNGELSLRLNTNRTLVKGRILKVCQEEFKELFTKIDFDFKEESSISKSCNLNQGDFDQIEPQKRWIFKVEKNTKDEEQYTPIEIPLIDESDIKQKIFKSFLEESIKNTSRRFTRPLFFEFSK